MKRFIFAVSPASRDAAEDALGALLGEGWGRGCLVPYPQPARPDQARPAATSYVCDVHLDDDQAAKLEGLAVASGWTLSRAVAKGERGDEPRKTLREVLTAREGGK